MSWRRNDVRPAPLFPILAAILMLTAVGPEAAARGRAPTWIQEVPQDARYLYGVGVSTKVDGKEARMEAVAMGIASIATAIYSAVSESYDEITDERGTTLQDRVNLRTAHALEGAEVVDVAVSGRTTYALVGFPRSEAPAARARYAKNQREAEDHAEGLIAGVAGADRERSEVIHLRDLIRAVNLLEPYGGHQYEAAKGELFAAILAMKLEATRSDGTLQVRPGDLPVRLGARRFTGKLALSEADRLRRIVTVDTFPFVAQIQNPILAAKVADALGQKQAVFEAECVAVEGRLSRQLSTILPSLGICVGSSCAFRLTGDYTAWRDEAYSLPLTNMNYTISLAEGTTVQWAHQGSITVVGDEKQGLQVLLRQIRSTLVESCLGTP
ncbi:MAG: hypothetical protein A3G34_14445 [Candidatus Lindowbacteria bacterium RIFCSPLOWO2_12_FULL_62_27]|nr:MAG: hypothetical protein A3I06_16920 [Candidatus Lindowbacteria bacterium RIFCSPLOWO2_02_FULL_62_12]OGH62760.1 MAG: hypothetical protein A3G34_14445 [Candidatus Lindowbacteria bacterium RIFCSPLOWO2_12_FULL_62_27]